MSGEIRWGNLHVCGIPIVPDPEHEDGEALVARSGDVLVVNVQVDNRDAILSEVRWRIEYAEGVLMRDPFDDAQRAHVAESLRGTLSMVDMVAGKPGLSAVPGDRGEAP